MYHVAIKYNILDECMFQYIQNIFIQLRYQFHHSNHFHPNYLAEDVPNQAMNNYYSPIQSSLASCQFAQYCSNYIDL